MGRHVPHTTFLVLFACVGFVFVLFYLYKSYIVKFEIRNFKCFDTFFQNNFKNNSIKNTIRTFVFFDCCLEYIPRLQEFSLHKM